VSAPPSSGSVTVPSAGLARKVLSAARLGFSPRAGEAAAELLPARRWW